MINLDQMNALKRQARQRVAAAVGLTLEQALDQIARENGFSTWSVLLRVVASPLKREQRQFQHHNNERTKP